MGSHFEGFEVALEGGQDVGGAVWGVAFHDGQGTIFGAEEIDCCYHAAEEGGEDVQALPEVQNKEIGCLGSGGEVRGLQVLVTR